jgi:hypothetical protein
MCLAKRLGTKNAIQDAVIGAWELQSGRLAVAGALGHPFELVGEATQVCKPHRDSFSHGTTDCR